MKSLVRVSFFFPQFSHFQIYFIISAGTSRMRREPVRSRGFHPDSCRCCSLPDFVGKYRCCAELCHGQSSGRGPFGRFLFKHCKSIFHNLLSFESCYRKEEESAGKEMQDKRRMFSSM